MLAGVVGVLIWLWYFYKKKLLKQQLQHKEVEAAYQHQLLEASVTWQDQERRLVAEHIRNDVIPSFEEVLVAFEAITGQIPSVYLPEKHAASLTSRLKNTIGHIRAISAELSPPELHAFGLIPALKAYFEKANALFKVSITANERAKRMDTLTEGALYRIIRSLFVKTYEQVTAGWVNIELNWKGRTLTLAYTMGSEGHPVKPLHWQKPTRGTETEDEQPEQHIEVLLQLMRARVKREALQDGSYMVKLFIPLEEKRSN